MGSKIYNWIEEYTKPPLCYDHFFANLFYWMYRDLDCGCCIWWRGVVFGTLFGALITTGGIALCLNLW